MYTGRNRASHEDFLVDRQFMHFIQSASLLDMVDDEFRRLRDPVRQQERTGIVVLSDPDRRVNLESILLNKK